VSTPVRSVMAAWCEECDGAEQPHRLGTVVSSREGSLRWDVYDRRLTRKLRISGQVAAVQLTHFTRSKISVPDELPAACEIHGWGVVPSAEVLAALKQGRASIMPTMKKTATA
jgi:hypothetical protein